MMISRRMAIALLLTGADGLSACSNGDQGPLGSVTNSSASSSSKKFWDRCINGECPPMETDDKPKPRTQ
jgi:hypothetical protein